jgi:hypothetical protein
MNAQRQSSCLGGEPFSGWPRKQLDQEPEDGGPVLILVLLVAITCLSLGFLIRGWVI